MSVAFLFLIGALVVYFLGGFDFIFDSFAGRFEESNAKTLGSRTTIINDYQHFFSKNPVYIPFGVSALNPKTVTGIRMSLHNGLWQIFASYGIYGITVFTVFLISFMKRNQSKKIRFIFHIPFIISFIYLQTIQFLSPGRSMIPLIMCALFIKMYKQLEEVKQLQGYE